MNYSKNWIINTYNRELGLIRNSEFVSTFFANQLDSYELNKKRTIETNDSTITWLSLETIDYRYLLGAKTNGNLVCVDVLNDSEKLKPIFNSKESESHKFSISCIQWYTFDNGTFFTSGMDEMFKIWETNTQKVVSQFKIDSKINNFNISSGFNNLVALGLDSGLVRFIDLRSGSFSHIINNQSSCLNVKWSPINANLIASAGYDGKLLLYDIRSPKSFLISFNHTQGSSNSAQDTFRKVAHEGAILGMSFTANGNYLISIGKDDRLRLWNVLNGLNTLVNFGKISFQSYIDKSSLQITSIELNTRSCIFVPSNRNIMAFDMFSGSLIKTFKGHFDSINCSLYNPSLNEVYTGSKDKNILVWGAKALLDNELEKVDDKKRKSDRLDTWSDSD